MLEREFGMCTSAMWRTFFGSVTAVAVLSVPVSGYAQEHAGRILGSVMDSASFVAIGSAEVGLVGTGLIGVTNDQGRFFIPEVAPGTYRLTVRYAVLVDMGVDGLLLGTAIVRPGETTIVELHVPSIGQLLCGSSANVLFGLVKDRTTNRPISSANVSLTVVPAERSMRVDERYALATARTPFVDAKRITDRGLELSTDEGGRYAICGMPEGTAFTLTATANGYGPASTQTQPSHGETAFEEIGLARGSPGFVSGIALDASTRQPISGVFVALDEAPTGVVTDSVGIIGAFAVRPGFHTMRLSHVAYGESQRGITVEPGDTLHFEALLEMQPHALGEIRVIGESTLALRSKVRGTPTRVLTRPDIELLSIGANTADQLIRAFPGVEVHGHGIGRDVCIQASQRIVSRPAGSGAPQGSRKTGGCDNMTLIIDDVLVATDLAGLDNTFGEPLARGGGSKVGEVLATLPSQDIESIEFLKPSEAGTRFGTLAGQGVIVIYTRGNGPYSANARPLEPPENMGTQDMIFAGTGAGLAGAVVGSLGSCLFVGCPFGEVPPGSGDMVLGAMTASIFAAFHFSSHDRPARPITAITVVGIGLAGIVTWHNTEQEAIFFLTPALQIAAGALLGRR